MGASELLFNLAVRTLLHKQLHHRPVIRHQRTPSGNRLHPCGATTRKHHPPPPTPLPETHSTATRKSPHRYQLAGRNTLATQTDDAELAEVFGPIAKDLRDNTDVIDKELLDAQGNAADLGGYYWPDEEKTSAVMRPSATFNKIIDALEK